MSDLMASHKVMRHYLNALLTEEQEPEVAAIDVKKQQLNQLLSTVSAEPVKVVAKPVTRVVTPAVSPPVVKPVAAVVTAKIAPKPVVSTPAVNKVVVAEPSVKVVPQSPPPQVPVVVEEKAYRQGKFQALFFEVAGLKVALPLKDLGGIHKVLTINTLPGKPDWYKGVMLYREQKINVVDTAKWVMPEKYDQQLAEKLDYQYVIMLGKSTWGLACEALINTVTLEQDDVKWRAAEGKRPWLAGLIKQHMCALLDVDAMIALLAQGAGSSD
jgi:purine-binding chemotaxis protein CheW